MESIEAAGFLFDMDGTLVDSTPVVEAVWTAFGERHGIDPATLLAYAHGRQAVDTIAHFLPQLSEAERGVSRHAGDGHDQRERNDRCDAHEHM